MASLADGGKDLERADPVIVRTGPLVLSLNTANIFAFGTGTKDVHMASAEADLVAVMGEAYKQCSAARSAVSVRNTVNVNIGFNGESSGMEPVNVKIQYSGSLACEKDKAETMRTFRGSRMCRGDKIVNESVTLTLDPLNLACLTCPEEHLLAEKPGPAIIFLSDQNMDPVAGGNCTESPVATIRMENASLADLGDLLLEVFDGRGILKPGSVVLANSLSHLATVGSAKYAGTGAFW